MANFSSSGLVFLIFVVVFHVICGGFIGLRFWAAKLSGRSFCMDDGFIVFAYANSIALGGVGIWAACNGLGKSMLELTPEEIVVCAKLIMASNVCWLLASVFVKMSILWMFNRIFATRQFRRQCWALIALNSCYGVSFLVVYLTNCQPIDQLWNPSPTGHCRNMEISDFATIAINVILDLAILILPLPTLWSLQLPVRKKMVVTIMFSFGLATIGIMMWRITATVRVRGDTDFTKHLGLIGLISFFEIWLGIMVACMPQLGPLFHAYVRPLTVRSKSSSYAKGSYVLNSVPSKSQKSARFDNSMGGGSRMETDLLRSAATRSEERLVPHLAITTDITSGNGASAEFSREDANVIHVRSDIELFKEQAKTKA